MSIFQSFFCSQKEWKKLRTPVTVALLIAVNLVLNMFRLDIGLDLRIGFGFLSAALCGAMFGPSVAMVSGALTEIISYLVKPTGPYFPGFTLTAVLGGAIYGVMLYRAKPALWRCVVAKGIINLFLNAVLNTLWLSMLYGDAISVLFPVRLGKNMALLVPEAVIMYVVFKGMEQVQARMKQN